MVFGERWTIAVRRSLSFYMAELRNATWRDKLLLLFRWRSRFQVQGDSMLPTLKTGDVVVVDRFTSLEPGDMVAAAHPYKKSMTMIKRIESINSDGRFMLIGDNSDESTDSRAFGSISRNDIAGKVIARLSGQ